MRVVIVALALAMVATPAGAQTGLPDGGAPIVANPDMTSDTALQRLHSDPEASQLFRDYQATRRADGGRLTPAHAALLEARYDRLIARLKKNGIGPSNSTGSRLPPPEHVRPH